MMRIETSINLIPEQPSEAAWAALRHLAAEWNRSHLHRLVEISGIMLQLRIPDTSLVDRAEIRDFIDEMESALGVKAYSASRRIYNEQDYCEAAFVEIGGASLDRPGRPFVLNTEEALEPPVPCPKCGWQDIFNAPQTAPFMIDESILDDADPEGESLNGGWDCVALPAGRLLVSERLLIALRRADVRALEVLPVLAADTRKESARAFQLSAAKAVLVPCLKHESDKSYCFACGAVLDSTELDDTGDSLFTPQAEFRVNREQLAEEEVLSRHPSRAAMLYFAQRAYRIVHGEHFNGVGLGEIIQFCVHLSRA
jgi:hypothetical protein